MKTNIIKPLLTYSIPQRFIFSSRRLLLRQFLACFIFTIASISANGATRYVSIDANTDDQEVREDGSTQWVGQTTIRVGGSNAYDACGVIPFQLPALSAGESITGATFSASLISISNSPTGDVDLYGLDYRSTSTANPSTDFYDGVYGGDTNATPIDNAFATTSSSAGYLYTDTVGESNLVDYINAQYATGASAGDYIFIRLTPSDDDVGSFKYWKFDSANTSNKPILDLEITESDTQAPSVPTGVVSSNITTNSVDLDWNASSDNVGVIGYNIYLNGANPMSVTGTSATVAGLSSSTSYTFTVSAYDAIPNESTQSSSINVTTLSSSGGSGGTLISEDFSSSASNFTPIPGANWSVSNGRYILSNPADSGTNGILGNISVHNTILAADYTLSALIRTTGTSSTWNDVALIFDYQNSNNYYYVSLNESNDGFTHGIFKVIAGSPSELVDFGFLSISSDTDYNVEVVRSGTSIVVSLNSSQIASISDSTFAGGQVGFGSKNDSAQFDNLTVDGSSLQSTLFSDDFNDGNANGWSSPQGSWSVDSNQYLNTSYGLSTAGDSSWTDYSIEANVKPEVSTYSCIIGRYQSSNNFFQLEVNVPNSELGLWKNVGGSWTKIGSYSTTINTGTWYLLKLEMEGSVIKGYLNGIERISLTDSTFSSGSIALRSGNDTRFDDVIVVGLGGGSGPSQVAAPSFNPNGGTYSSAQNVTITTATSGATIRYTTNGSNPSSTSGTIYTGPVSIASTSTLKAIAYKSGMTDSSIASASYTINTGGSGGGSGFPTHPNQTGLSAVGINRSTLPLASTRKFYAADSNTVVENVRFDNTVELNDTVNITFRKCWFQGGAYFSIRKYGSSANTTFEDCDFGEHGSGNFVSACHLSSLAGTNNIRRCFFYNSADGIKFGGGSVNYLEDCWIQVISASAGAHTDCLQLDDSTKAEVYALRTTFEARTFKLANGSPAHSQEELSGGISGVYHWGNSILQTKPCVGGCSGPVSGCYYSFIDCLMTGGNYIATVSSQNGDFIDNTIVRGSAASNDLGLRDSQNMTISGNAFHDNGNAYNGTPNTIGNMQNTTPIPYLGL